MQYLPGRVTVAGPQKGKRGVVTVRSEEKSITVGFIRRTLSLAGIPAQSHSLLGRLEGFWRRNEALQLKRVWHTERKATALSLRNGINLLRRG